MSKQHRATWLTQGPPPPAPSKPLRLVVTSNATPVKRFLGAANNDPAGCRVGEGRPVDCHARFDEPCQMVPSVRGLSAALTGPFVLQLSI